MADIVLGCDSNGVNDKECQNTVKKVLEEAGHTVEALGVAPGPFADYSYSDKAKGKIGVYLMAASLVSFLDATKANFDFNVFGIRGDVSEWGKEEGFNSKGVPKDHHGDCTMPECDKYRGKTYPELNEIYKDKCVAVPGETPEKLGQNIVGALEGNFGTSSSSNSNDENKEEEEEEWDDKDNFTPHKGNIMEIMPYKVISSISFDKSYDSPSGSGNIELLYKSKDYQFLYKGVAMKLKLRRSCDKEWRATGLEEPDYDENEKFFKEHIPTDELLKELGLPNFRKDGKLMTNVDSAVTSENDSNKKNLSDKYINSISPKTAKKLMEKTELYDSETISKLEKRASESS